jgi:predicted GNAT family acetyltransferase
MEIEVTDNAAESRYEIRADGKLAGFSAYRGRPKGLAFTHTEILDEFEGQGLGSKLVQQMLDDVRSQGLEVLPICPFVKAFMERHREYVDLVPESERERYGL